MFLVLKYVYKPQRVYQHMHVPIHGMLLQMHHTTAWHHGNWYHGMHRFNRLMKKLVLRN